MSNYVPDSTGNKQVPGTFRGSNKYSTAVAPAHSTVTKRPSYVVINQPGEYAFSYDSGSGTVGNDAHNYITASVISGDGDRGNPAVRLDINPVAWRQIDAAGDVGDVTFVYVRVM